MTRYLADPAHDRATLRQLARKLAPDRQSSRALAEIVARMVEAGTLVADAQGRLALADQDGLAVGRLSVNRRGFGFVIPDEPGTDLYVAPERMGGAWHNDRVHYRPLPGTDREAQVVRIAERATRRVVGQLDEQGWVVPQDDRLLQRVRVEPASRLQARPGDVVAVEIASYGQDGEPPLGRVVERIGRAGDPGVDVDALVHTYELPTAFPAPVLAEAERIPDHVLPQELQGRVDLRQRQIVTIDSDDAKDLDDAVSLERITGGWRLGVHIADVSHYVPEGSALDVEALKRGTSVYLVDRVIPMLPERLSNGIASLNPGVDRLTLSVEVEIDETGEPRGMRLFPSVIRTGARLSYRGVNALLSGTALPPAEAARYRPFQELLQELAALRGVLRARRRRRGSIDFDLMEARPMLDDSGKPLSVVRRQSTLADSIIEESMLMANEVVATRAFRRRLPFLYRIHEEPSEERLVQLRALLERFGYRLPAGSITSRHLSAVLDQAEGRPEHPLLNTVILRSMQRARYSAEPTSHFGLALAHYTHFTSPIRRYPDLQIHRILRESLHRLPPERREHYGAILGEIAVQSSERERIADQAERESVDIKLVEFMEDKVGEEFDGVVSGVTAFGVFVELSIGVEGLVRVSNMPDDYYVFQPELFLLKGQRTGREIRLSDPVRVRVDRVSKAERQIDLGLVNVLEPVRRRRQASSRSPRGRKQPSGAPSPSAKPSRRRRKGRR